MIRKKILLLVLFLYVSVFPCFAHAERLDTIGFEQDLDAAELQDDGGTFAYEGSTVHSGYFAEEFNPSTFYGASMYRFSDSFLVHNKFFRTYFYVKSYPSSINSSSCYTVSGATGVSLIVWGEPDTPSFTSSVMMNSSGQIGLVDNDLNLIGSLSSPVSLNTWHYLEILENGSTGNIELRLDGTSVASASGLTMGFGNSIYWGVDPHDLGSSCADTATMDIIYDDIAINDDSGSYQNSWPGAGHDSFFVPSVAGDSNQWLKTDSSPGDSNNYSLVNSLGNASFTHFVASKTLGNTDLYRMASSSPGDIVPCGATVNTVQVGTWFEGSVNGTNAQFAVEAEKASGGTKSQSAPVVPTVTSVNANSVDIPHNYPLTMDLDPDGSPWTYSTIGTMQAGYLVTTGDASNYARNGYLFAYVDWTPGTCGGGSPAPRKMLLFYGVKVKIFGGKVIIYGP